MSFSNTLDTGERVGIPQEGRVATESRRGSAEAEEQKGPATKKHRRKDSEKANGRAGFLFSKQE